MTEYTIDFESKAAQVGLAAPLLRALSRSVGGEEWKGVAEPTCYWDGNELKQIPKNGMPKEFPDKVEWEGQIGRWGMYKIPGAVARSLGFKGKFKDLDTPAGFDVALQYLVNIVAEQQEIMAVIAMFPNGVLPNGDDAQAARSSAWVERVMREIRVGLRG